MVENYYEHVVRALRSAPSIRALGFRDGETDIRWYGKGADHHDLMVMTKPSWTIPTRAGRLEGYDGVNVHFESRCYGSFQVDCELTPRLGSEAKKNQASIAPLLHIKAAVTEQLRELLLRELHPFHVNTKRVRKDPTDPASLKVVGFELGLPTGHTPQQFVSSIQPIILAASPLVEQVIRKHGSPATQEPASAPNPILPGTVPDRGPYVQPPIPNAAALLERIEKTRGMPERNMEDVVKQFLLLLGHDEHHIGFQIGHVDVRVSDPSGHASMVIEVKRLLQPKNQRSATDQAFGYADRSHAPLIVVTDSDIYEVYDRRLGLNRDDTFLGRFQLTRFHPDDTRVLDALRPHSRACPACHQAIPDVAKFCPKCGREIQTTAHA
jgi:hypothetical protein